ncbi:MAG: hypothetical protein IKD32_03610 [Bacteroidales bacterium]|nr:hypothetical protein [Bacteroidales bacterium]MBR7176368.1 hypothetical protein [Bacteroidales bacterium]
MHNKRIITLLILLAVMAISPLPLKLFDNQLKAQSDAYFYDSSPDDRDGNAVFNFDDFANNDGDGFSFGNFNHTPDNVPLGSGLLLLTGFALLWRKKDN